jgi:hypothetical protein
VHSRIAWVAAATHVLASIAMLTLLRGGLPGPPESERLAYIHAHPASWVAGWVMWQLAAISLIALYAVLAVRFRGVASVAAMVVAVTGLAFDLTSEVRYIGVMPRVGGAEFAALDRELEILIGCVANGLYTLAFVLLAIAGWRVVPHAARLLSIPVALSGFALGYASYAHDARLELILSAILFPLFTLWIVLIAVWLRRADIKWSGGRLARRSIFRPRGRPPLNL